MERILAIGDVHGCENELNELIVKVKYNPDKDRLIFLGDLLDKGYNPKGVLERVIQLTKMYGTEVVGGNHEEIFLEWLEGKSEYRNHAYFDSKVGGKNTVISYYPKFKKSANQDKARNHIVKHYQEHIKFLENLPHYIETQNYIFVHAGIDPKQKNWKNTSVNDFKRIRTDFHDNKIEIDKKIVFGHTPTRRLHKEDDCYEIWVSDNKIGIDGGCVYGGWLHCLEIKDNQYKNYYVKSYKS
jgi:serine/threonine protein phosphatase 1